MTSPEASAGFGVQLKLSIVTVTPSSTFVSSSVTSVPSFAGFGVMFPTVGSAGGVLSTVIVVSGHVVEFPAGSVMTGLIVISPSGSAVSGVQVTDPDAVTGVGVQVQPAMVTVVPSSAAITTSGSLLLVMYGAVSFPSMEVMLA